jgi:hypothetical protein
VADLELRNDGAHLQNLDKLALDLGNIYPGREMSEAGANDFVRRCTTFILDFQKVAKAMIDDIKPIGGEDVDRK